MIRPSDSSPVAKKPDTISAVKTCKAPQSNEKVMDRHYGTELQDAKLQNKD